MRRSAEAVIAHLKLLIAKLKRDQFGRSVRARPPSSSTSWSFSSKNSKPTVAEDETIREGQHPGRDVPDVVRLQPGEADSWRRCRPICRASGWSSRVRPSARAAAAGSSKLGEDVTETLEVVPRQLEGDPDRAREVHLPRLRDHHPAAGTLPRRFARGRAGRRACSPWFSMPSSA